jgi:hypothetical protein
MANFFIRRPIVAIVIAILTVIVGVITILWSLGDERYALVCTRRSMTTMSLRPGDRFVMLHGLSEHDIGP